MEMSTWENNGNIDKCLAGVGMEMRFKLMGLGRIGKADWAANYVVIIIIVIVIITYLF